MKSSFKSQFGKTKILEAKSKEHGEKLVVVPGFSEGITHTKKLLGALAAKGYDAVSFSQPRKRGDKTLDPVERQSKIFLNVLDKQTAKDEKVHAVAHSLGGGALLKAAIERPEKFDSITILEPAGVVGRQRFGELLRRVGKKVVKNQLGAAQGQNADVFIRNGHYTASADTESALHFSTRVNNAQLAGLGAIMRNPANAVREASAAGQYNMTADALRVHELGIPIHIVKAESDEMFDSDKVNGRLQPLFENGISVSSVADPTARHDTSWMQAERTARIVDQTIQANR